MIELPPRPRQRSPLLAAGLRVEVDGGPDDGAPEPELAGAWSLDEALELIVGGDVELEEAIWLLEGAYYDPAKHPRWPAGTPGGLGGKFMKVGQRFELNGVEYDVEAVLPGKIHARVATKGVSAGAKTVEISADQLGAEGPEIKGIQRPKAETIVAATPSIIKSTGKAGTATVIDPYNDPSTHDPSIPIPEAAQGHISPEQWKRFGRLDQEKYSQVMERFGKWQVGQSEKHVNAVLAKCDKASADAARHAIASQKGQSSGFSLSIHSVFGHIKAAVKGTTQAEELRKKYEMAKYAQSEAAAAIQWDLYNRTRSPDVSIFHKHGDPSLFQGKVLNGDVPVFSGLSQSQSYRNGWWDYHCFATPMSIRHVVMSTVSANIAGDYGGEQEVSVADPYFATPGKSIQFSDNNVAGHQAKWLEGLTKKAGSGEILEKFIEALQTGEMLPVAPAEANLVMNSAGGKQYVQPPAEALVHDSKGVKVTEMSFGDEPIVDTNGVEHPPGTVLPANQLGLKPGDYIQGNKVDQDPTGTKYLIVADPSDQFLGLAYLKVTEADGTTPHTGAPEVWHFGNQGKSGFKKLSGHFDDVSVEEEQQKAGFNPDAFTESAESKFIQKFKAGEKFNLHGSPYEVITPGANATVKSLQTGEAGQLNGDYVSTWLVPKAGYTEEGVLAVPPPQVGDTLAYNGKKATVTKLLSGGVVQINLAPGVVKLQSDDPALEGIFSGKDHELGEKTKLKSLAPGQKFHGGTGGAVRPYVIVEQQGKTTLVRNLDTGVESQLSANKSFAPLYAKTQLAESDTSVKAAPAAPTFDPNGWELGETVEFGDLDVGAKISHGGVPYQVTSLEGKGQVENLVTGISKVIGSEDGSWMQKNVTTLVAKKPALAENIVGELAVGDQFQHEGVTFTVTHTQTEYATAKSAAGVSIDLHNSTAVTFVPKAGGPKATDQNGETIQAGDTVIDVVGKKHVVSHITDSGGVAFADGGAVYSSTVAKVMPVMPADMAGLEVGKKYVFSSLPIGTKFQSTTGNPNGDGPVLEKTGPESWLNTASGQAGQHSSIATSPLKYMVVELPAPAPVPGSMGFASGLKQGDHFWLDGEEMIVKAAPILGDYLTVSLPNGTGTDTLHKGTVVEFSGPDLLKPAAGHPAPADLAAWPVKSAATMKVGDYALNKSTGTVFQVIAPMAPNSDLGPKAVVVVTGKANATSFPPGKETNIAKGDWPSFTPAAPESAQAGPSAGDLIQKVESAKDVEEPAIWKVKNVSADGQVKLEIVKQAKTPDALPVGYEHQISVETFEQQFAHATPVKVGDTWENYDGEQMTVTSLEWNNGDPVANSVGATGGKSMNGVNGITNMIAKKSEAPALPGDLEDDVPPNEVPPYSYDPSAYVAQEGKTLADAKIGDIFVGAKNGKHYLVTKTGAPSGLTALDLQTGKTSTPWKYDKKATLLLPKAANPFGYDEYQPGDPVLAGNLKPGDHFELAGHTYEVAADQHLDDQEPKIAVHTVQPNGELGPKATAQTWPLATVTFKAKAADVAAQKEMAKAVGMPVDATALPDAAMTPFSPKSKTGGGYVFSKVKHAAEGTLLQDKAGQVFKVKTAGGVPVLSNGSQLVTSSGDENLKVVDVPFEDNAPDAPSSFPGVVQLGAKQLEDVPGSADPQTAGELSPGDTFTPESQAVKKKGTWFVIEVNKQTGAVTAGKLGTAKTLKFPLGEPLESWKPAHAPKQHGESVLPSQLQAGDKFTSSAQPEGSFFEVGHVFGPAAGGGTELALIFHQAGSDVPNPLPANVYNQFAGGTSGWKFYDPQGSTVDPPALASNDVKKLGEIAPGTLVGSSGGTVWKVLGPGGGAPEGKVALQVVTVGSDPEGDSFYDQPLPDAVGVRNFPSTEWMPDTIGPGATATAKDAEVGDKVAWDYGEWHLSGTVTQKAGSGQLTIAVDPQHTDFTAPFGLPPDQPVSISPADSLDQPQAVPAPDHPFGTGDTVTWQTEGQEAGSYEQMTGKVIGFEEGKPNNVKVVTGDGTPFYVVDASKLSSSEDMDDSAANIASLDVPEGDDEKIAMLLEMTWGDLGELLDEDATAAEYVADAAHQALDEILGETAASKLPDAKYQAALEAAKGADSWEGFVRAIRNSLESGPASAPPAPPAGATVSNALAGQPTTNIGELVTGTLFLTSPTHGAGGTAAKLQSFFGATANIEYPDGGDAPGLPVTTPVIPLEPATPMGIEQLQKFSPDGYFQTSNVSGIEGENHVWQLTEPPGLHTNDLDHIWATNATTGELEWFGKGLSVTPLMLPNEAGANAALDAELDLPQQTIDDLQDDGKATFGELPAGAYFKSVNGTLFWKSGFDEATNAETDAVTHGVVASMPTTKMKVPAPQPSGLQPLELEHGFVKNDAALTAQQLGIGGQFQDNHGNVHEIIGTNSNGGYWAKMIDSPKTPAAVGTQMHIAVDYMPPAVKPPKPHEGDPFHSGPNFDEVQGWASGGITPSTQFKVGDVFKTPLGGYYEVTASVDGAAGAYWELRNLATGATTSMPKVGGAGTLLVPPTATLTPGDVIPGPAALKVGMAYTTSVGNVYQVLDVGPGALDPSLIGVKLAFLYGDDGKTGEIFHMDYPQTMDTSTWIVVDPSDFPGQTQVSVDQFELGKWYDDGSGNPFQILGDDGDAWWVGDDHSEGFMSKNAEDFYTEIGATPPEPDDPLEPAEPTVEGPPADLPVQADLKPFSPKSKSGGGYFFGQLGHLPDGTKFKDKTGAVYTKKGSLGKFSVVYEDAHGKQFTTSANTANVKLLGPLNQKASATPAQLAALEGAPSFDTLAVWPSAYGANGEVLNSRLSELLPGQKFRDAADNIWEVVAHKTTGGPAVVYVQAPSKGVGAKYVGKIVSVSPTGYVRVL